MTQPVPGSFCHVEIITNDPEAATTFYESAFGWKIQRMGPEMGNYIMYEAPGGMTGGIRAPNDGESPGTLTYLLVKDLDAETQRLTRLGAKVVAPRHEIPGWGSMAILAVPGGTTQALWQPNAM